MQHLNRVVCQVSPDDEFVCTLIVDDGLYVVRTGNVGGLMNEFGNNVNATFADADTQNFVEELVENEERLKDATPDQLRNTPGTLFLAFSDIRSVDTGQESTVDHPAVNTMTVHTRLGDLRFVFSYAREEDIDLLRQTLEQNARQPHANA